MGVKNGGVEMLGLIDAVELSLPGAVARLLWCDGEWRMLAGGLSFPAPGVPRAATSKEARRLGVAWVLEHAREETP